MTQANEKHTISLNDIHQGEDMLAHLQAIIGQMAADERSHAPQYQELLEQFRLLSSDLHHARQAVKESNPAPADVPANAHPLPAGHQMEMPKFKETLGPASQAGAVSMGEEVGRLQRLLAYLGFSVTETEDYDRETQLAVTLMQRENRLPETGMVSAQTRAVLNQMVSGQDSDGDDVP